MNENFEAECLEMVQRISQIKCFRRLYPTNVDIHTMGWNIFSHEYCFNVGQTDYYLIISVNKLYWIKPNNTCNPPYDYVKFENVFENAPEQIKEELVYYLDLFR